MATQSKALIVLLPFEGCEATCTVDWSCEDDGMCWTLASLGAGAEGCCLTHFGFSSPHYFVFLNKRYYISFSLLRD